MMGAVVLALSRPFADAPRPPLWLALGAGGLTGMALRGAVDPTALLDALRPAAVLAAGWMALSAAQGWRPAPPGQPSAAALARLLVPAAAVGLVTLLAAGTSAWTIALLAATVSLAVDPAAARLRLQRTSRPSPTERGAPAIAARAGAIALAATVILFSLALPGDGAGVEPFAAAGRAALCLGLGVLAGAIAAGLMRLVQGRAATLALLVPLPLLVWGAAGLMGAPALAAILIAGLIVARDAARRDLLSTVIAEVETPMAVTTVVLLGVMLATLPSWPAGSWTLAGVIGMPLALAAPVAGRAVASATGLSLPLSPLAAAMALEVFTWAPPVAGGLALGMATGEILWLLMERSARGRHA